MLLSMHKDYHRPQVEKDTNQTEGEDQEQKQ